MSTPRNLNLSLNVKPYITYKEERRFPERV